MLFLCITVFHNAAKIRSLLLCWVSYLNFLFLKLKSVLNISYEADNFQARPPLLHAPHQAPTLAGIQAPDFGRRQWRCWKIPWVVLIGFPGNNSTSSPQIWRKLQSFMNSYASGEQEFSLPYFPYTQQPPLWTSFSPQNIWNAWQWLNCGIYHPLFALFRGRRGCREMC